MKQRVGEPVRSWCFRRGQGQRSLTRPTIWARFATRPDRGARRASLRSASVVRRPTCAQRATWAALNDESGPGTDVGRGEPKPRAGRGAFDGWELRASPSPVLEANTGGGALDERSGRTTIRVHRSLCALTTRTTTPCTAQRRRPSRTETSR